MATTTLNDTRSEPTFLGSVRWKKAAQAGLAVGAIFFLVSRGMPFVGSGLINPAVMGREVAPGEEATPLFFFGVMALHLLVSVVYALIMAPIINSFRPVAAGTVGALVGLILYFLNYAAFGFFFEPVLSQREWAALLQHIAFGIITAEAYKGLARRTQPNVPLM